MCLPGIVRICPMRLGAKSGDSGRLGAQLPSPSPCVAVVFGREAERVSYPIQPRSCADVLRGMMAVRQSNMTDRHKPLIAIFPASERHSAAVSCTVPSMQSVAHSNWRAWWTGHKEITHGRLGVGRERDQEWRQDEEMKLSAPIAACRHIVDYTYCRYGTAGPSAGPPLPAVAGSSALSLVLFHSPGLAGPWSHSLISCNVSPP